MSGCQNETQATRIKNRQCENIKVKPLEELMGPGQLPQHFGHVVWGISLIQGHRVGAGTLSPPTQSPFPQDPQVPGHRSPLTQGIRGVHRDKDTAGDVKGLETEAQLSLRVTRRGKLPVSQLLSLLQRTDQSLLSPLSVALISLLCYSSSLSLGQLLLFAQGTG